MTRRFARLTQVGPFPPPIYGMAVVNEAMAKALRVTADAHLIIDIRAHSLERSLIARLRRLPRVLAGWFQFLRLGCHDGRLYISLSGGFGQIYELGFIFLARLKRQSIVLHHHSFAYLTRRRPLTAALVALAGPSATHVTLSENMLARLKQIYPRVTSGLVVSNSSFLNPDSHAGRCELPSRPLTIGFLGNVSKEKGIWEFLAVLKECQGRSVPVRGIIAGPFQDEVTACTVRAALDLLRNVEYWGPVDGQMKHEFLRSIDILLFASRYVNEAEPLVVLESMMNAIPVIAFARGALPELLDHGAGVLVSPEDDFVAIALSYIDAWNTDPAIWLNASRAAFTRFKQHRQESLVQLQKLIDMLLA